MSIIDTIKAKAKADVKHIVLPEGSEERTVQAARLITDQGIAKVTLIGDPDEIKATAAKFRHSPPGRISPVCMKMSPHIVLIAVIFIARPPAAPAGADIPPICPPSAQGSRPC